MQPHVAHTRAKIIEVFNIYKQAAEISERDSESKTRRGRKSEREGRGERRCGCHMLFEAEARKKPKLPLNSLAIIIKHIHIHTHKREEDCRVDARVYQLHIIIALTVVVAVVHYLLTNY